MIQLRLWLPQEVATTAGVEGTTGWYVATKNKIQVVKGELDPWLGFPPGIRAMEKTWSLPQISQDKLERERDILTFLLFPSPIFLPEPSISWTQKPVGKGAWEYREGEW